MIAYLAGFLLFLVIFGHGVSGLGALRGVWQ